VPTGPLFPGDVPLGQVVAPDLLVDSRMYQSQPLADHCRHTG
jgi:hypothetical protein